MMRTKHIFGLVIFGVSLAAAGAGCVVDVPDPIDLTGAGGSGSTASSGNGVVSSSTGVPTEDTNIDCQSAEELALGTGEPLAGALEDVTKDRDYYTFTGKKGEPLLIRTDAKPMSNERDPTYADLVITVYDSTGKQVARNDDPYPLPAYTNDSEIVMFLPEDDTYCVEVTECAVLFGADNCRQAGASDPEYNDYTIEAGVLNLAAPGIGGETEPNDMVGEASPIDLNKFTQQNGQFQYASLYSWGGFSSPTDLDMWSFTVPPDVQVEAGARATCHFDFWMAGSEGNGSTLEQGVMAYIASAADPATRIAQIDITKLDTSSGLPEPAAISVPCNLDGQYLFVMERPQGATAGANDFYFFQQFFGGSNPVEKGPNDDMAMPEVLAPVQQGGSTVFFVDGDIDAASDVDYYSVTVPAGMTHLAASCVSQRGGSAVRGLKVDVLGANDMPVTGGVGTSVESDTTGLFFQQRPIPQGAQTLKFKVSATSLDPNVTSGFYRCGFSTYVPG